MTVGNSSFDQAKFDESNKKLEFVVPNKLWGTLAGRKVLDYGCGWGRISKMLGEFCSEVHGCDVVPWAIEESKRHFPEGHFQLIDPAIPFLPYEDGYFGGVVCWTVLQHMRDEDAIMMAKEFRRILCPSGMVFIYENTSQKKNAGHIFFRSVHEYIRIFESFDPECIERVDGFDGNDETHHAITFGKGY